MPARRDSGFTLIEILLAFFLIGVGLLAAAPMFVYGVKVTANSADRGALCAGAVTQFEALRQVDFAALAAGGSLTANVVGYSDTSDPGMTLRWTIEDDAAPPRRKTITVVAISTRTMGGGGQQTVRLTSLRTA